MDPTARVVMATADVQASSRALAEAGGAVGFVCKPLAGDAVLRAVDAALAGEGATR
jgi:DNA-binding NarL/FixJ family response regulator